MEALDRRRFLKGVAAATAGGAVLAGPFAGFVAPAVNAGRGRPAFRGLREVADSRDEVVRLLLPDGFSYRSFHDTSSGPIELDDESTVLPGRHDGMGAFAADDGATTLVRNHEINGPGEAFGASGPIYDSNARGGTTTTTVTSDGVVLAADPSLSGTQMNCAGGVMPWGSWITCEETVNGPDVYDDFTRDTSDPEIYVQNAQLEKPHGFIFEVPAAGGATGVPIRNAGRFAHEAVAFDPVEGVLYLTEDDFGFASGFYKYVPPEHPLEVGALHDGGDLFMLKVRGVDNAQLQLGQPAGASYRVEWVPIDEPFFDDGKPAPGEEPSRINDDAIHFVSDQGFLQGAASFSRLEGAVYDKNVVYFCSTQGGATPPGESAPFGFGDGRGQIWGYHTRSQKLSLVYESPSSDVLDFPDNVTTSPGRGTLVVCEDGGDGNFLRGLRRDGTIFDLAQNVMDGRMDDEFAGATFNADGSTLFVNIQARDGLTFAIRGPWSRVGF